MSETRFVRRERSTHASGTQDFPVFIAASRMGSQQRITDQVDRMIKHGGTLLSEAQGLKASDRSKAMTQYKAALEVYDQAETTAYDITSKNVKDTRLEIIFLRRADVRDGIAGIHFAEGDDRSGALGRAEAELDRTMADIAKPELPGAQKRA